jgi:hypothetical protein
MPSLKDPTFQIYLLYKTIYNLHLVVQKEGRSTKYLNCLYCAKHHYILEILADNSVVISGDLAL